MRRILQMPIVFPHRQLARGLVAAFFVLSTEHLSAQGDTVQVRTTLERFFAAARAGDTAAVRAAFDSTARLTLLRPTADGGTRVVVLTGAQFVQAVAGNPIDEPVRNVRVTIDGPLAAAWGEYQVRTPTGVSHCGYDAFHLVRRGTEWKILSIADSYRREGCGARWP